LKAGVPLGLIEKGFAAEMKVGASVVSEGK
jgi:hypothetical protein